MLPTCFSTVCVDVSLANLLFRTIFHLLLLNRLAYGNDGGLVVMDIMQKSVLISMATSDLYSSADPYTRLPRSPKRPPPPTNADPYGDAFAAGDQCRSPSTDQVCETVPIFSSFFFDVTPPPSPAQRLYLRKLQLRLAFLPSSFRARTRWNGLFC